MRDLVPHRIERRITQAKVGGNVDDFTALLEQRRHQVHGFATGQRHKRHIGVTANALRVHSDHGLIDKTTQIGVELST